MREGFFSKKKRYKCCEEKREGSEVGKTRQLDPEEKYLFWF